MTRLLSCAVLLVGSMAAAAVTDFIEVQLPASQVMPLLADRARGSITCLDPFTSGGEKYVVDHLEFPAAPTLRRSPTEKTIRVNDATSYTGHPVQALLPVKTFLKKDSTLKDPAATQDQYDLQPTVSLVFDLSVRSGSTSERLCASVAAIEPAFGDDLLDSLRAAIGTQCFPLQLDGLDDLLDHRAQVTGRGMSLSADQQTLAFRLEFDEPVADAVGWRQFGEGQLAALGQGQGEFAVGLDLGLVARVIRARFASQVGPPLTLTSGIDTEWLFNAPLLHLWFDADVSTGWCWNDIGVEPFSAQLLFTLAPGGGAVRMSGDISTDLVDSDVLACGAPFAGVGALFSLALAPVIEGVLAGVAGDQGIPGDVLPTECSLTSDEAFWCDFPLALPLLDAGGPSRLHLDLTATQLTRVGRNLVVRGGISQRGPLTAAPRVTIESPVHLSAGVFGSCSDLHVGSEGHFRANGAGEVCSTLKVSADPQHVFWSPTLQGTQGSPWDVTIDVSPTDAFTAAPYEGRIVTRTSGGARTVSLIADAPPTLAEQDDLLQRLAAAKVNCMAKQTGLFGIPGLFDPRWKVDPPVDLVSRVRSNDPVLARSTVRVRLEDVQFETLSRTTRPLGAVFSLPQQNVKVSARAVVDFGGKTGTRTVAVSTVVQATLSGEELGKTGIVTGRFPAGTTATFQVNSSTFPTGIAGVDFTLDLSPRNLELQGTLTAQ